MRRHIPGHPKAERKARLGKGIRLEKTTNAGFIENAERTQEANGMKGTRPLDNNEIRQVSACFTGIFEARNRGLFMLGVSTGGRISELLSLTIGDVYQNRKAVTDLLFDKSIVKGGEVSRAVPVNKDGRRAIDDLSAWHREHYRNTDESRPLFPSRHKSGTVSMHRQTAHEMLKQAFTAAGLNGKLATHSLRNVKDNINSIAFAYTLGLDERVEINFRLSCLTRNPW